MASSFTDLSAVPTEDLLRELESRKGLFLDTWCTGDVLPIMEDYEQLEDLSEEELIRYAEEFLDYYAEGLGDVLRARGSDYLQDKLDNYVEGRA